MATRPDNLETTRLSLELLRRIPRHRKVTAAELRDQVAGIGLERDVRSIQRLLNDLSEQFDIERDGSGKPYGYRWKENAAPLAVPLLSPQDALLLSLAEHYLRPLLPASIARSLGEFFEQGRRNLRQGASTRLEREWMDKIAVASTTQPLLPPTIAAGVFEAVSEALYRNLWLELDYRNARGERRRQARVMPLGLAQQGPCLYLVARFEGYDDERSLALHRMSSASATNQSFERPADFSLARYDADGRFGFGEGRRVRLQMTIATAHGRHLLETPLSKDQVVREDGDVLHVTATVVDSQWLWNWIRGFGDAVSSASVKPIRAKARTSKREQAMTQPKTDELKDLEAHRPALLEVHLTQHPRWSEFSRGFGRAAPHKLILDEAMAHVERLIEVARSEWGLDEIETGLDELLGELRGVDDNLALDAADEDAEEDDDRRDLERDYAQGVEDSADALVDSVRAAQSELPSDADELAALADGSRQAVEALHDGLDRVMRLVNMLFEQ